MTQRRRAKKRKKIMGKGKDKKRRFVEKPWEYVTHIDEEGVDDVHQQGVLFAEALRQNFAVDPIVLSPSYTTNIVVNV